MFNKSSEPPSFTDSNAVNKVWAYKKSYYNETSILTILYAYNTFCGRHTRKNTFNTRMAYLIFDLYFISGKNVTSSTCIIKKLFEF